MVGKGRDREKDRGKGLQYFYEQYLRYRLVEGVPSIVLFSRTQPTNTFLVTDPWETSKSYNETMEPETYSWNDVDEYDMPAPVKYHLWKTAKLKFLWEA